MSTTRPRISVLLVEDSPDQQRLMQRALSDSGIAVRTVGTGAEALEAIDGADLVLLDYRLPGMSGLETLRAIRKHASAPSVVMVTGMGSEDVAVEAMRSGATDYVVKDTGYLARLPEVVERAWRHHDLKLRADELLRLALLVNSSLDGERVMEEVVAGAERLLRADWCAVCLLEGTAMRLAAVAGVGAGDPSKVLSAAETLVRTGERPEGIAGYGGALLTVLAGAGEAPFGVLAVLREEPREFGPEERDLAEAFGSFAALALANSRRFELERALVEELQRTTDARRDLLGTISHELRTPLTSIKGFSATLLDRWPMLSTQERLDFVSKIHTHSDELESLANDLVDLAVMERGRPATNVASLDLREEVTGVIETLAPILAERPVEVDIPEVVAFADPLLLRRTLGNLLSNAVKYSARGTPIRVRGALEGDQVRIEVSDEGIGLSPEEARMVFQPFWRGGAIDSRRARGAGIGLALVAEYVKGMGGALGVTSEIGKGSTFYFTLRIPTRTGQPVP